MDDPVKARDALAALGDCLHVDARAFAWTASFVDGAETFELGLALTLAPAALPSAQLYYNPRRRVPAFREQVRALLAGFGFDGKWLRVVDALAPPEAVSTVLGLDVGRDGPTSGTLYLEEIGRWADAHADAALCDLGLGLGLEVGAEGGRVGVPYIWAVDFGAQGPLRLKVYRAVAAGERRSVEDEAVRVVGVSEAMDGAVREVLFGAGPCSGYMVQRAYGAGGEVLRHKIYRCYPYEHASTAGQAARALHELGLLRTLDERAERLRERLFDDVFGTTSVAIAFAPGRAGIEYATVYQALLRGRRR